MPHSISSSLDDPFQIPGQAGPHQTSATSLLSPSGSRPHTPVAGFDDMLSPGEAEYAFNGDLRRASKLAELLAGKADSPLDYQADRQKRPHVPPLDTTFQTQQTPYGASESRMSFRGTQLEALDEHVKATVPILVHLRTNVIVRDEFKLVTKLSTLLAQLYACSHEAIMINIDHSVCLMLASSFDPAYFLHLSTVPAQMDRHSNGYNTNEIQKFMHRILKVPAHRGMIRFQPISEDNVGTKNTTVTNLNARLSRPRQRSVRPHSRANTVASLTSQSNNPVVPSHVSAHDVLVEQITSLSERGSVRSGFSSHARQDASPTRNGQTDSWTHLEPRNYNNDAVTESQRKKPRPQSTHSYFSSVRDYQSSGWKDAAPLSLNGGRQRSTSSSPDLDSDSHSDDMNTAEPPPIPQSRGGRESLSRESVKQRRRRSIFSVFKW